MYEGLRTTQEQRINLTHILNFRRRLHLWASPFLFSLTTKSTWLSVQNDGQRGDGSLLRKETADGCRHHVSTSQAPQSFQSAVQRMNTKATARAFLVYRVSSLAHASAAPYTMEKSLPPSSCRLPLSPRQGSCTYHPEMPLSSCLRVPRSPPPPRYIYISPLELSVSPSSCRGTNRILLSKMGRGSSGAGREGQQGL